MPELNPIRIIDLKVLSAYFNTCCISFIVGRSLNNTTFRSLRADILDAFGNVISC